MNLKAGFEKYREPFLAVISPSGTARSSPLRARRGPDEGPSRQRSIRWTVRAGLWTLLLVASLSTSSEASVAGVQMVRGEEWAMYRADRVVVFMMDGFASDISFEALHSKLGPLFADGRLTGEMFFEAIREPLPEQPVGSEGEGAGSPLPESPQELWRQEVPILNILDLWERRGQDGVLFWEVWATPDKPETGWGSFDMFRIDAAEAERETTEEVPLIYLGEQI